MATVETVIDEVRLELNKARQKHAAMHSPHEGYAVILEELDELWEEIKTNRGKGIGARKEAAQVAAMAIRYMVDLL